MNDFSEYQNQLVKVYKKDNLIYCSHPTSASSLYEDFVLAKNWQRINYQDICWKRDHVFSFIMDPVSRHCNGLRSDIAIQNCATQDYILNNRELFFSDCFITSYHSIPLWNLYGEFVHCIDWIPLDLNHVGLDGSDIPSSYHTYLSCKLFQYHNLDVCIEEIEEFNNLSQKRNVQDKDYDKLIAKIKHNMNNNSLGSGSSGLYVNLQNDFAVYHSVIQKTHHWENTWDRISWLHK